MRRVILESPYAGVDPQGTLENVEYARKCMKDCLLRGEAPFASHLLYTQEGVLDDTVPDERRLGMEAGISWYSAVEASVVYTDRGISRGMKYGIEAAQKAGVPIEYRKLETNNE